MSTASDTHTCPDSHKCRNGSFCKEDDQQEGSYYCDCSLIERQDTVFVGLSCEHEATVYCNPSNQVDHVSFCANGGTCLQVNDADGTVHYGCSCKENYKGDHCEFTKDQNVPDDWPTGPGISDGMVESKPNDSGSDNDTAGRTTAIVASVVSVVVVAMIALLTIYMIRRKGQKSRMEEPHMDGSCLHLEPDGTGTFREGDDDSVTKKEFYEDS